VYINNDVHLVSVLGIITLLVLLLSFFICPATDIKA